METYKIIEIKRLRNNMASVRDYVLKDLIENDKGLILKYEDERMTIPPAELKRRYFQCHPRKFQSKFDPNQEYELYDFVWVDDKSKRSKFSQQQLI